MNKEQPARIQRFGLYESEHPEIAYKDVVLAYDYDALLALHKASLSRERELQAKIAVGDGSCDHCGAVPSIIMPTSLCDECADGVKRAESAESQLRAKDALIASLNEQIKGYRMAYDYDHDCDEQLYAELGVPLCDTHQRHCWAHVASWLVENKKSQEATIASLKYEILKQNKAEDELLATGEKLAEDATK